MNTEKKAVGYYYYTTLDGKEHKIPANAVYVAPEEYFSSSNIVSWKFVSEVK